MIALIWIASFLAVTLVLGFFRASLNLFCREEIDFKDFPVIMTEKDAVKCKEFADQHHWVLSVTAQPNQKFIEDLYYRLCL